MCDFELLIHPDGVFQEKSLKYILTFMFLPDSSKVAGEQINVPRSLFFSFCIESLRIIVLQDIVLGSGIVRVL